MTGSAEFFRTMVEPTVREYLERRGDLRLGRLSAILLNQMTDYWTRDGHARSASTLRDQLRADLPAFALLSDVADAAKHATLTRKTRTLTTTEQVSSPPGLFHAPFGTGVFNEAWSISVVLDDGSVHALDEAVLSVLAMWQEKLNNYRNRLQ